jgi:outer membrane protein OmpA-like peptidoglycan-associated protein/tetratricopeptide (TPR) repeat protein
MKIFIFLLISFVFLVPESSAQTGTRSRKAQKLFDESTEYIRRRQYPESVELLLQALDKDPAYIDALLRLATAYRLMNDPENAVPRYEALLALNPPPAMVPNIQTYLMELYYDLGSYEKARETAQSLLKILKKGVPEVLQAELMLAKTDFALEQLRNPLDFDPQPLEDPLNQMPLQYFPVLTVNQKSLIFTGRRGAEPNFDEDIYISRLENGGWTNPEPLSPQINSNFNEGTCTISADGKTLIFTSCMGRQGFGACDLFISYKTGDNWSVPENLGRNVNSRSWDSQPSLSADGKVLYFISDRGGGVGKRDVWMSVRNRSGEWSEAVNLGRPVNTPEDEVSPFIHVNGQTLFVASRGYPGMGGFDLFRSERINGRWEKPANLGYPLNTSGDEVSLFITADGKKGYYSLDQRKNSMIVSSRIFQFDVPASVIPSRVSNYITGTITDAESGEFLKAEVELFDLKKNERVFGVSSDSLNGIYYMVLNQGSEYALYITKKGYLFESRNFNYLDSVENQPIVEDFALKPIKREGSTTLNNIFFEFDSYRLDQRSKTELERMIEFLQKNPDVSVEISGHTDNIGTDAYNQELSANRAKSVYDYLVENGIQSGRLSFHGYGSSKPLVENETEAQRSQNRRIDFTIQ